MTRTTGTDRKHTHTGHCQLCDNSQAIGVASNRIAKHGYTKRWGFFSGTCPGSDHQPYELSADLLPERIAMCKSEIARYLGLARACDALSASDPTYGEFTFVRELPKEKQRWGRERDERIEAPGHFVVESVKREGTYEYTRVKFVAAAAITFQTGEVVSEADSSEIYRRGTYYGAHGGPEAYAAKWREGEIEGFDRQRKQYSEYKAWLTERLLGFVPRPLTPVVARNEARVGVEFKYRGEVYVIVSEGHSKYGYRRPLWNARGPDGKEFPFDKAQVSRLLNQAVAP